MRVCAVLLAVGLAIPSSAGAQSSAAPVRDAAPAPAATPAPAAVAPPAPATPPAPSPAAGSPPLDRIKRALGTGTPLRDAAEQAPTTAMFRTSVTERVDIWKFWGDPEAVAAYVRPSGGTWHNDFLNMVTPDEFRGYGGILNNGEKAQLAATSLAFAGAMKLLGMGVQQVRQAAHDRTTRKAKEEVQRELEAFYALHPEARPTTPLTPP